MLKNKFAFLVKIVILIQYITDGVSVYQVVFRKIYNNKKSPTFP